MESLESKNAYKEKSKKSLQDKTFVCEICGEITPKECEGTEPNTCAMCMPCENPQNLSEIERNPFD